VTDTFTAAQKMKTRWLCVSAIRSGKLSRRNCEKCGADKTEAHHDDYSKPLDVRWLCKTCHGAVHRGQTKKTPARHRRTHCARGHALMGHNLMTVRCGDGRSPKRKCRECHNAADRRGKQRRKSESHTAA